VEIGKFACLRIAHRHAVPVHALLDVQHGADDGIDRWVDEEARRQDQVERRAAGPGRVALTLRGDVRRQCRRCRRSEPGRHGECRDDPEQRCDERVHAVLLVHTALIGLREIGSMTQPDR
jgi:hypothetical protein